MNYQGNVSLRSHSTGIPVGRLAAGQLAVRVKDSNGQDDKTAVYLGTPSGPVRVLNSKPNRVGTLVNYNERTFKVRPLSAGETVTLTGKA